MSSSLEEHKFFHWGVNKPEFLSSILSGEKHFKYFDKNFDMVGAWLVLGPTKSKPKSLFTSMIKIGRLATPSEFGKHDDDYHVKHGIIGKKKRREWAYFIDEVIKLPDNTVLEPLVNNVCPQRVKKGDVHAKLSGFVQTIKARSVSF